MLQTCEAVGVLVLEQEHGRVQIDRPRVAPAEADSDLIHAGGDTPKLARLKDKPLLRRLSAGLRVSKAQKHVTRSMMGNLLLLLLLLLRGCPGTRTFWRRDPFLWCMKHALPTLRV